MKTNRLNALLISLIAVTAASATVAHADVRLKFKDGNEGVMWRDGNNVVYKLCAGPAPASRDCQAIFAPPPVSEIQYAPALRAEFGVKDSPYAAQGGMTKLRADIADTEAATNDPSLSDEDVAQARQKLLTLKNTELNLMLVDNVLANLDQGKEVVYDQSFGDTFAKIVAPFGKLGGSAPGLAANLKPVPEAGLVAVELGHMCWYDAAGKRRPRACETKVVQKGCALALGRQWRLPTRSELNVMSASAEVATILGSSANAAEGPSEYSGVFQQSWTQGNANGMDHLSPSSLRSMKTICVAQARDVDANGDVDGDGILNGVDRCNSQPNDLTALVEQSGPRMGCAAGQSPDTGAVVLAPVSIDQVVRANIVWLAWGHYSGQGDYWVYVFPQTSIQDVALMIGNTAYPIPADGAVYRLKVDSGWATTSMIPLRVTLADGRVVTGQVRRK